MAFNGSGVFVRLYNWVNDAAANIKIRADRMDNEMNGFATGLSTCITKDGQTTITANLPMANFRHTGVGAGAARTDYTRLDQSQDGKLAWVDGGGTADAITASYAIPLTALVDGQLCYVRATAANATTTPTFSPSALTARTIVKNGGQALAAGDISGDGHELILRYDLTNTRWELLNPKSATIPFTAASAAGPASLDFAEDTDNGTNKVTLSAPASLTADRAITFPDAAGNIVLDTATQNLTNKTYNGATVTSTTGTLTLANSSTLATSGANSITLTSTGSTNVTLPTSGTLATTANTMQLIQTQTVSGVASVNFTGLSSTYSVYVLKMANVVPATDATDLWVRTSSNNGSSYDAGASDYAWTRTGNTDAGVTAGAGGSTGDTKISIGLAVDNAATSSLGGTLELFEVASSARHKHVYAEVSYTRDASTIAMFVTGGKRASATAVNAFQVLMSSGNISGTFSLYGVSK